MTDSLLLRLDLFLCTPYVLYSLRKRFNLYILFPNLHPHPQQPKRFS